MPNPPPRSRFAWRRPEGRAPGAKEPSGQLPGAHSLFVAQLGILGLALWATACHPSAIEPSCQPTESHLPSPPAIRSEPTACLPFDENELDAEVTSEQRLCLEIELQQEETLGLEIDQSRVDLVAEIHSPATEIVLTADTPVGNSFPERLCFVAAQEGLHRIYVYPYHSSREGPTSVRRVRRGPARPADHLCLAAYRRFERAERHYRDGLSEGLAREYHEIHTQWLEAGESFLAVLALRREGDLWKDLGDREGATRAYYRALELAREAEDLALEADLHNRLGNLFLQWKENRLARERYELALTKLRGFGPSRLEASVLNNLAYLGRREGQWHWAVEKFEEAAAMHRALGAIDELVTTRRHLALSYAQLGRHRLALRSLEKTLEIAGKSANPLLRYEVLDTQGRLYLMTGDFARARDALVEVAAWREARSDWKKLEGTLDLLGSALVENREYERALTAYRQSEHLSLRRQDLAGAAVTQTNIGCLLERQGHLEAAGEVLAAARPVLVQASDFLSLSHLEYCSARIESSRGRREAALERIADALQWVDQLRRLARQVGERHRPNEVWQDYADLEIALLMASARETSDPAYAARAFEASELARARGFLSLVTEAGALRDGVPRPGIAAEEWKHHQTLNRLRERLDDPKVQPGSATAAEIERQILATSLTIERAEARVRREAPSLRELGGPRPTSVDALQARLPPETLVLSYVLGEERSVLFVIGADRFESHDLPGRARIGAVASVLRHALVRSAVNPHQAALAAQDAAALLLPASLDLEPARRLLILPTEILHYLPFEALPGSSGSPRGEAHLLGDRFEIFYAPSASVFVSLGQRPSPALGEPRLLAIYADPDFSSSPDPFRIGSSLGPGALRQPPARLPFTHTEAAAIRALVPPDQRWVRLGPAASKANLLRDPIDRFRILHFATHAVVDEDFPELSHLLLAADPEAAGSADQALHLHEISALRLRAELVVLSGCQTAVGQVVRGDGLVSLARGFFAAGAPRVVVSLWEVDDEATATLMACFYEGLLVRGESPAEALAVAKRRLRSDERWEAPYFWAAFVLQGLP